MKLLVRIEARRLRRALSLTASAFLHASVLAWVALGPALPERRPGLYEQEIHPYSNRIIWYSLKQTLPPISPAEQNDSRPARARARASQQLVAGARDVSKPPQLIWTPAPPLETAKILPSPNLVALARPSPPVKQFVPPPAAAPKTSAAALPSAPELTVPQVRNSKLASVLPPLQQARKLFVPPVEAPHGPEAVNLPNAPQLSAEAAKQPLGAMAMAKPIRQFSPPPISEPPAARPTPLADAPALAASHNSEASLAIVSLVPVRTANLPEPKASQQAGFSAGPQPRADGGLDMPKPAALTVPGLLVRGAPDEPKPNLLASVIEPPTSRRNLQEAARAARITQPEGGAAVPARALRVASAPDPRLEGRQVYSLAIQMPNVTSFSGSWLIWFAEREGGPNQAAEIEAPLPLRKVDPKYTASAVEDKVEGKVRLAAVIRKDGHVDGLELLQHLDSRLDQSAQEALSKWEFRPALRNGVPVDVDAVFDIPFHLAPRTAK
jgi:TonB family protein